MFLLFCMLLLLLGACNTTTTTTQAGQQQTPTAVPTAVAQNNTVITPLHPSTTLPVPPTQIACPPTDGARAMITAPLALGSHDTVVYTLDTGSYDKPNAGELLRYDTVTGQSSLIVKVANAHIYGPQVSTDGQWVLFTVITGVLNRTTALQMVRLDGQGRQTLYCAAGYAIQQLLWSTTERYIAFYNIINNQGSVSVLDTTTGFVQTALTMPANAGLVLRSWLDASHLALSDAATDTIYGHIFVLDVTRSHQQYANMQIVLQQEYGDFDSSTDGTRLFVSFGGCPQGVCTGPSSIKTQQVSGGPQHTIYNSNLYDVVQVRVLDQKSLLFIIGNTSSGNASDDLSKNGLWRINNDGTGLQQLASVTALQFDYFNYHTQASDANVSRDDTLYALQINGFNNSVQVDTLVIGSLNGSTPPLSVKLIATANGTDGTQLAIAGWTTT